MIVDQSATGGPPQKLGRIFWLGAHKLLVNTELARLRQLGFEVFNPPYLSHVLDQSAITAWDANQNTTLPSDVFEALASYNFFYETIEPRIAEIINNYFNAVVVTIVPRWLSEVLRVFSGPIWFRTYGQTSAVSDELERCGARPFIEERNNFVFSPHSAETADIEADWLLSHLDIIPYCINPEVFETRDTWVGNSAERNILISAPNILGNIFHKSHYNFLKEYFFQSHFRFLGVQPLGYMEDPQVVGSLRRETQLDLFRKAAGYLYTYRDPRVCYLPPIEMMVLGGPVVYLSGSLLARYIGPGGPGEAGTILDAHDKCSQLRRKGSETFAMELRESQRAVVDRYDPTFVWPQFDKAAMRILSTGLSDISHTQSNFPLFPEASPDWIGTRKHIATILSDLTETDEKHDRLVSTLPNFNTLSSFTEDEAGSQLSKRRPMLGRRDFLERPFLSNIGQWGIDQATSRRGWHAFRGTEGFLHFGPYETLQMGRYEACFTIQISTELEQAVGSVDILTGTQRVVAQHTVMTNKEMLQTIRLLFDVDRPDQFYEFRAYSNGVAQWCLYELTLSPVSQVVPQRLDDAGFVPDGFHLTGDWVFDPAIGWPARRSAIGQSGWLQYGPYKAYPAGRYELQVMLRSTNVEYGEIALIDVVCSDFTEALAVKVTAGFGMHVIRREFELHSDTILECRVYSFEAAEIFLYSVLCKQISAV